MQVPVQALLQQTLLTQKLDAQSEFSPTGTSRRSGILPQLMFTHVLPGRAVGRRRGARRLAGAASHMIRARTSWSSRAGTCPRRRTSVAMTASIPCSSRRRRRCRRRSCRQAPAPLHLPSVPHDVAPMSAHWVAGVGAVPAATGEQVPTRARQVAGHAGGRAAGVAADALLAVARRALRAGARRAVRLLRADVADAGEPGRAVGGGRAAGHAVRRAADVRAARSQHPGRARARGVAARRPGARRPRCTNPARTTVLAAYLRQAPAPLHCRRARRSRGVVGALAERVLPSGMFRQVPSLPGTAHDLHVPVQAAEQHRPCAQMRELHSASAPQAAPSGFLPQLLLTQLLGATQSASVVQLVRQSWRPSRKVRRARLRAGPRAAAGAVHVPVVVRMKPTHASSARRRRRCRCNARTPRCRHTRRSSRSGRRPGRAAIARDCAGNAGKQVLRSRASCT